jgi:hypothetical protein
MKRTWAYSQVAALLAAVLAGGEVAADPTNYQRYVIGERALGMGGAQTAAVNDPMANLYNPAAMVFTTSTMVSASKCLYSLDSRKVKGGFVPASSWYGAADAITLSQKNDLTLPSTLALSTKFGPRLKVSRSQRHAIGIAILVPNQDKFTLRGRWSAGEGASDKETYALSESYTQVWMGLSYAFRAIDELGLGVSVFLQTASFERDMTQTRYGSIEGCTLLNCGFMNFTESALSIDTVSLLFRVGALWEPHPNWRFGLTVSAPSILIPDLKLYTTEGKLSQTYGEASVEGTANDRIVYFSDSYKLKVKVREPMSFRAGAAYLWGDMFTVDFDVSVHLPVSYRRIGGDPVMDRRCPEGPEACAAPVDPVVDESASPAWYDPGILKSIERRAVVNFNLGWELIIDDTWTIRNGVFTDFSSAPPVVAGPQPQQTRVSHYGAGVAAGFKYKGYDISVGVTGSLGQGYASVYDPHEAAPWQPAAVTERALYVFIAGVTAAAVKGSKTVVKKTQKAIEEAQQEDGEGEVDEEEGAADEGGNAGGAEAPPAPESSVQAAPAEAAAPGARQ